MLRSVFAALGLSVLMTGAASAQILPGQGHHYPPGQRIPLHHGPGRPGLPAPSAGQIIGNRRTKVFHLPGDRSPLPAPKNRVYFRTVAQAMAAGYHAAGRPGVRPPHGPHPGMRPPYGAHTPFPHTQPPLPPRPLTTH